MTKFLKKYLNQKSIAVIGLGYVGLPLASALSRKFRVIGFDINKIRIKELKNGFDRTNELNQTKLKKIFYTSNYKNLKKCKIFIITVPTPVNRNNKPDLKNLLNATKMISKILDINSTIILESTVYPSTTEDIVGKLIEKKNKYKINKDFFLGYSPERINPGDKIHTIDKITKVVSGSNDYALKIVYDLYSVSLKSKIYKAQSIKVAESAKIIENTQRDLNIGLMNELKKLFDKININTYDVIKTAGTKWNFNMFYPGLVGGHCIGVDPYYLSFFFHKNQIKSDIINAGRKINDNMHKYFSAQILNLLKRKKGKKITNIKMLILGFTFKQDIPDIRNTKVADLFLQLKKKISYIDIYDPYSDYFDTKTLKKYNFIKSIKKNFYDIIVLAVKHKEFSNLKKSDLESFSKSKKLILYKI